MLSGFLGEGGAGGGFFDGGGPGGGGFPSGPLGPVTGPVPGAGPGAVAKVAIKREAVIIKTNLLKRLIIKLYVIRQKNK